MRSVFKMIWVKKVFVKLLVFSMSLFFSSSYVVGGVYSVQAATISKGKVNELYRQYLDRRMVNEEGQYFYIMDKFVCFDVNKDGIKEMITQEKYRKSQYLYTIYKGKVKFVGPISDGDFSELETNKQNIVTYNQRDKTILRRDIGSALIHAEAYCLSGTKLKEKYSCIQGYKFKYYGIGRSDKEVTKKKYDKYFKSHFNNPKYYKLVKNTVKNKKKYLK